MITLKVKLANSFLDKSIGLLNAKKPFPLLLKTRFGIHTFGMKYPIDVIVLNNQNSVVSLKEQLKPQSIYFWNIFFNTIIELPAGTVKKEKITRGSLIKLEY